MEKFGLMTEAEITKVNEFDVPNVQNVEAKSFARRDRGTIVLESSAVVL